MKHTIKSLALTAVFSAGLLTACKKSFFDTPPLGSVSSTQLNNKAGVDKLLIGAYSSLDLIGAANPYTVDWKSDVSNWFFGDIASGDAYKGDLDNDQPDLNPFENFKLTSANPMLVFKWQALYDGASRCNDVLRATVAAADMTDDEKTVATAQARALRGHFYLELKKLWNRVPYVDENAVETRLPNDNDIWPNIEDDFKYAADNLPETFPQVGRINKWAAKCYLAKTYMFQRKYAEAKAVLDEVLVSGKTTGGLTYGLEDCFRNAFDVEHENGKESVFAVQMAVSKSIENDYNGSWFWALNDYSCCKFFRPSRNLANAYRTDASGLPLLDTWNEHPLKNDIGLKSSDPFTPETGTLDPRLDWTLGRRGIPFLDYGPWPGKDMRDANTEDGGPYTGKKYTRTNAQGEKYGAQYAWAGGVTAYNYTVIRFADVLLWAAEAEVEAGSPEKAREYVNRVRNRAKNSCQVENADGTPAANYLVNPYSSPWTDQATARKAVRFERRLELALEGHRFYDLVRWQVADQYVNTYIAGEKTFRPQLQSAAFQANKNEYVPIPESEIINSAIDGKPTLTQNPGY
ncbi:MAG: RagB/SusD family nutrient uptake outer membrane protein [Flavihumibacter sp.]